MEKDIEELVLEAKPLFEQGKLSLDMIELIEKQNEVIEQLTHALLAQKSNFHV